MDAYPTSKRLLEAFIFAALAGGVGYLVTAWLAPEGVSAGVVAAIVATVVGVITLEPGALTGADNSDARNPWRPPKARRHSVAEEDPFGTEEPTAINPETGFHMIDGPGGVDAAGNPYGYNND